MKMRKLTLHAVMVTSVTLFSTASLAGHQFDNYSQRKHFTDTAKVTSVVPIYKTVRVSQPGEQCYDEFVDYDDYYQDDYESATPMIAGGVLGGILGNQFGKGRGKTIMTVAGAVLGGSIGRDYGHRKQDTDYKPRTESRCETINEYHEEEELDGYRVSYRYRGETFHTTLPYHPGKRLKLDVSIKPYE